MTSRFTRRDVLHAGMAGLAGAGMVVHAPLLARAADAPKKKFKIALSNSYIGNKWRIEMENVFKAALQMEPFKSEVEGTWFNSGNDASKQSQQISNLIAERVDAIVVNAASPTALNGILRQATSRGILVVSFDNVVTAPTALKVNTDQVEFGRKLAEWLVKKINGQGNIIMVTGVAGTTVDLDRNKGAEAVWAKNPNIKVVNRYTGMWDSATAERNTAAILPSLPKIDGIWCQGGTDGVLKAFISAKRTPLPPTAGEAENGFRKFMIGYMGQKVDGISIGQPPFLSVISLELARRVLQGKYPKKDITIPFPYVTNDTVKAGETVFPNLPDSFFTDFTDGGVSPMLKLCADAALDGKACAGRLAVTLPSA
ncbi:MAG TPA: sugar ABC transporter substrate-binding protein [Stellaceae bacterium]|nr:sugar ABC transporter substrate-binding protein [Stellaceae bacterium]